MSQMRAPSHSSAGNAFERLERQLARSRRAALRRRERSEFVRAEHEDDDGYDPYSDRRISEQPLFERRPWD